MTANDTLLPVDTDALAAMSLPQLYQCKTALYAIANTLESSSDERLAWGLARALEDEAAWRAATSAEDVVWKLLIAVGPDFNWDANDAACIVCDARQALGGAV
ncbi:hypothetical protein [uncultured Ruegeria sp.]|uniref:hypothetical protein n=1 Tax=uncultured Ruegeria sp. TaxID=259304 RepID=UPI002635DCAA|nr:hypothetical protein [uncultured Ruegeria sp.]